LRQYASWHQRNRLHLFQARRADIKCFGRDMQARGRARATIARHLCTVSGFLRYAVEEELLEHSPAVHVRRPRLDYESHAIGLDRSDVGALLAAAGLGAANEHALISLLAINGLRICEALGADIGKLGLERGHATRIQPGAAGRVRRQTRRTAATRGSPIARCRANAARRRETDPDTAAGTARTRRTTTGLRPRSRPNPNRPAQKSTTPSPTGRAGIRQGKPWHCCVSWTWPASGAEELAEAATEHFERHPDSTVVTSLPGLGPLTGARVLAEIGDDRSRFANARALKAFAGAAPVTRASGKTWHVLHRRVKNQRLAAVGYLWAFASLNASPGARAHYDRRRTRGDRHVAAQRNLFNRLIGVLHHCLQTGQPSNENIAFPPSGTSPSQLAA
jgi:Transposase IS116/IS110/IS902 family